LCEQSWHKKRPGSTCGTGTYEPAAGDRINLIVIHNSGIIKFFIRVYQKFRFFWQPPALGLHPKAIMYLR
jgi:hypothetical protein